MAITIGLLEIGLRVFNAVKPLPIFYDQSYNRFRGKPFAPVLGTRLNSRGFNDEEHAAMKPRGAYRVLGIGDSFAFGVVPREANYLTLLHTTLSRDGHPAEIVNMGIPGTGPADYAALLLHEGLALKPDHVVVSVFIGNDILGQKLNRLYAWSYTAALVHFLVASRTAVQGDGLAPTTYDDSAPTFTRDAYVALEARLSRIFQRRYSGYARDLAGALTHLLAINDACRRAGIRLTVVLIPDEMQVDGRLQQDVATAAGLTVADYDFARPNTDLNAALAHHGIDHTDLREAFVARAKQMRLYKPYDTHWNIAGNAFAAELIARHMNEASHP